MKFLSLLRSPLFWGLIFSVILLICAVWVANQKSCAFLWDNSGCITNWAYLVASPPNEIGDALAGFAGALAFVWIVVTVWQQSIELRRQSEEFSVMNERLGGQEFEQSFNEFLSTLLAIVDSQSLRYTKTIPAYASDGIRSRPEEVEVELEGRRVMEYLAQVLSGRILQKPAVHDLQAIKRIYGNFWKDFGVLYGQYLRFISSILKFLESSKYAKEYHYDFLRTALSDADMNILFYHAISDSDTELSVAIARHHMLEDLQLSNIPVRQHLTLLKAEAFGEGEVAQFLESTEPLKWQL